MSRPVVLPGILLIFFAIGAARAEPPTGAYFKVQAGGHLLTQDSGLVPEGIPDSSDSSGGFVLAVAGMKRTSERFCWGAGISFEGNRIDIGPDLGAAGIQTFGIVPLRVTGQMEYWLRRADPAASRVIPYLWAAAGWTFNSVGTEIEWFGDAPSGAPTGITLDDSPALGVGLGIHAPSGGAVRFSAELSLQWNRGDYTLFVADAPDRHGRFNLSGVYLLLGLTIG
ncbi:MAG: hypothetical protein MUC67_11615 [Acidobacteria bacterium]|jgi:hypothetical protein|nr:hypothetical protein [Acidobacteriota bacterium]MCU0254256.1 hypothetical protein [Acidobacteriota bacterium]